MNDIDAPEEFSERERETGEHTAFDAVAQLEKVIGTSTEAAGLIIDLLKSTRRETEVMRARITQLEAQVADLQNELGAAKLLLRGAGLIG
jgi:cell division protein FtsB